MLLPDFLDELDSKSAFQKAASFFALDWRRDSFYVDLKSDLLNIPLDFVHGCRVSSDALHFLNFFRRVKKASVEEVLKVVSKLGGGEWESDYAAHHLKMYADSFVIMGVLGVERDGKAYSAGADRKVAFVPVFSEESGDYFYRSELAKGYSCSDRMTAKGSSQNYLSLSVNDGFLASRGGQEESMYGF